MSLIEKIDKNRLPRHVAIIMDGNGRWAKAKGKDRSFGHQEGVVSVRKIMDAVTQLGLKYLTLYTFSTENWNRPEEEVQALMSLLVRHSPGDSGHDEEKRSPYRHRRPFPLA